MNESPSLLRSVADRVIHLLDIEVKEIFAGMERPAPFVVPASRLNEDLLIGNLEMICLAALLESSFNIDLPDAEIDKLETVSDLIALVEKKVG